MMHALRDKIRKGYLKNMPDLRALSRRLYPRFVFDDRTATLADELPVFTFHSVQPASFEPALRYLRENGYRTLNADEIHACLIGETPIPERAVALTFDDGRATLWTTAFPLLEKYGMTAICFVTTDYIAADKSCHPCLSDVWSGNAAWETVRDRETPGNPFCTWPEIQTMHDRGVIDFQAHTRTHSRIAVGPRIEDFMNPGYDYTFYKLNVPVFERNGTDAPGADLPAGSPVHVNRSRMSDARRYHDSGELREKCAQLVQREGEELFFRRPDWRRRLRAVVRAFRATHPEPDRYETSAEQHAAIREEFLGAKRTIESRLLGKTVRHFAFPWFEGGDTAIAVARETGYVSTHWGILPGRRTNAAGDDPMRIVRIPYEEYIHRLPGSGRWPLSRVLRHRYANALRRRLGAEPGEKTPRP